MALQVVTRQVGNIAVVKCSGRLVTGDGAERLFDQVNGALKTTAPQIVIDLSEVTFIDSSGLGTLVRFDDPGEVGGRVIAVVQ